MISRHINNVFKDGKLAPESNMQKMHSAGSDKPMALYSLDVIISVGYRVKSQRGVQFRQWVMGDEKLRVIAHELLVSLRENVAVDWAHRESARARLRVLVKRILRKYGYPPDLQDAAVQTVLQQAEVLSAIWQPSQTRSSAFNEL